MDRTQPAPEDPATIDPGPAVPLASASLDSARREQCVVLVVDLVESVRLMVEAEATTVAGWCAFVAWVRTHLSRQGEGEIVKSLGDGLLLVFGTVSAAWATALAMHRRLEHAQWSTPVSQRLWLRMGLHRDWVYRHALDVFGAAPNLAARLGSLARAGETVCSESVWQSLQAQADVDGEDLGWCWLKHLAQPVRAFRLLPHTPARVASPGPCLPLPNAQVLQPLLALMATRWDLGHAGPLPWADWVRHGLAMRLGRVDELRVVDPLSSGEPGLSSTDPGEGLTRLKADHVLLLHGRLRDDRLTLHAELLSGSEALPVVEISCQYPLADVLHPASEMLAHVADQVLHHLLRRGQCAADRWPLHNLDSHSLLLAGIAGLHGDSRRQFLRARVVFEHLVERHPRLSVPRVWLSHWHVLSITRGMSEHSARQVQEADLLVRQALWHQPDCPQAWAAQAFVQCHLQREPALARESVLHALRLAPSQAMAWSYRTTIDSLLGHTRSAYEAGQQALRLAPLGPLRYYHCCLAGHAALFDGRPEEAMQLLESSCALNPWHSPTLRMLVVAHHDLGNLARAREVLARLRQLEPALTVARYLARSPGGHVHRARFAHVLAAVGLPRS